MELFRIGKRERGLDKKKKPWNYKYVLCFFYVIKSIICSNNHYYEQHNRVYWEKIYPFLVFFCLFFGLFFKLLDHNIKINNDLEEFYKARKSQNNNCIFK